ncbi:hypothetical protein NE237_026152 [Protea cynaroides]|uniref:Uncharacterized protein n=1 Tax=Protea cynaroides TaxID=273540 RepID=A0A9Q0K0W9_9MAGN|nr:hypothetical protein NE237_026152 [Protea cynaroides]
MSSFLKENSNSIRALVRGASARVDAVTIDMLPKLEIVANYSVGLDKIDLVRRRVLTLPTPQVLSKCSGTSKELSNTCRLGGAGLDVFEDEPHVPEQLFGLDNVVLLPHVGSATWETSKDMADLVIANLEAHFLNKPLLNPVF